MPAPDLRRGAWALAAAFALLPLDARAQGAPPFRCGPDCSRPGRYVLCADNFDNSNTSAGGVVLVNFLERACVSFPPPAQQFTITGFAALFGPGDTVATWLQIFVENGSNTPGMELTGTGVGIPGAAAAGFTGLFFGSVNATTDFRLCLQQQIDDSGGNSFGRPLLFDDDGVQGTNWAFIPSAGGWQASGAAGDFILRPIVEYGDLTPWAPGGACERPDGGVAADSGVPAGDSGVPAGDSGSPVARDGGEAMDSGEAADSGDPGPASDAGVDPGGGDAGTSGGGPPTITAISPKEGPNTDAIDVTVTGTNFEPGAQLMIGSIQANDVSVPGSTTILAEVPRGIAPGVYDVIVRNPDDQTAILSDGYTVRGPGGGVAPPAADCGCRTAGARESGSDLLWILLGVLCVAALRPRARSNPPM